MLEVREEHGKQSEEENQKRKAVSARNVKFQESVKWKELRHL